MKTIYLAGGCFWGVQKYFDNLFGVLETVVGYAFGKVDNNDDNINSIQQDRIKKLLQQSNILDDKTRTSNPVTYSQVCASSGHTECVKIVYDDTQLNLTTILNMYLEIIDPLSINKQGQDIGIQYRTGIYWTEMGDKEIIKEWFNHLQENIQNTTPIQSDFYIQKSGKAVLAIEVLPLGEWYEAETEHQKYLDKNPQGYCHIPKIKFDFAKKPRTVLENIPSLRKQLAPLQYSVTMYGATEKPFDNLYDKHFEKGIYVDIVTKKPLFISTDKFDSGCGWPAFSKPIDQQFIRQIPDYSHQMSRTEVKSIDDTHLGHVFDDGPQEFGGQRYCINSAALLFIPLEDMQEQGYGEYKSLIQ